MGERSEMTKKIVAKPGTAAFRNQQRIAQRIEALAKKDPAGAKAAGNALKMKRA